MISKVRRLQDNVRDLSATVAAMLAILAEKQQLDQDQVRQRTEAMLAELLNRRPHRRRSRSRIPSRRRPTPPR